MIDVTIPATADRVKTAVTQVLTEEGYAVDQKDDDTLTTGYRKEISGPWDGVAPLAFWYRMQPCGSIGESGI